MSARIYYLRQIAAGKVRGTDAMSQVNFFMLPEDESEFVRMLEARGDTRLFPMRALDMPVEVYSCGVVLLNRDLGWPAHVDAIEQKAPTRATTTLDLFKDAHIEWARSYRDRKTLFSGRIYAKVGWLATPAANQTYRRWYDALARWIRQRYDRQDGWWVSPRAKAWWQEGNLLSFGGRSEGRAFGREAES